VNVANRYYVCTAVLRHLLRVFQARPVLPSRSRPFRKEEAQSSLDGLACAIRLVGFV
jgi:hypothetical protein